MINLSFQWFYIRYRLKLKSFVQQKQEFFNVLIIAKNIPFSPIYLNHCLNITSRPNANEYVRGKNPVFYLNIQL